MARDCGQYNKQGGRGHGVEGLLCKEKFQVHHIPMEAKKTTKAAKGPCPPLPADSILKNPANGDKYKLGRFLGKGGFAQCWEVRNLETNRISACKVVHKSMLTKPHQKEKMMQEIRIHQKLSHKFVVKFYSNFEDPQNVYVLLELCKRRSLMEVLKRRGRVTYHEARYFMHQLLEGVSYLHNIKIIHRDLKLGNLFLTGDIQLRIGDFGLATEISDERDKRRTLCGTPNYIAPEILEKVGHSYEVDIWSCGCILYTLLMGKPPFETPNLRQTYAKIQRCDYRIDPAYIPPPAKTMIEDMLQKNPSKRPNAAAALKYPIFTESPLPAALPESILTTEPRLQPASERRPLREFDAGNVLPIANGGSRYQERIEDKDVALRHISSLDEQLQALMTSHFVETDLLPIEMDNAADPASMPVYWVAKWVDYTDKYGLGYQLCDNSLAVLFNDHSRMVLLGNTQVHFIDHQNRESYHTISLYPKELEKKVVLLKYFRQYMQQHLMTAGADAPAPACVDVARVPYLRVWFRTQSAIVLFLSNGTLQLNFFRDHTKIILCPLMGAVSYIDKHKNFRTYSLQTMHQACPSELSIRLKYAQSICTKVKDHLVRL